MSALQQQRLAAGLCPQCGKDAAPFRLCERCRSVGQIRRFLNRAEKIGYVESQKEGRRKTYRKLEGAPSLAGTISHWKHGFPWEETVDGRDKRFRPRLRGVPVDVERQVLEIFKARGRAMTTEEVYAAWGKLRVKPDRESAARDMVRIIEAERKRAARALRRKQ